MWQWRERGEPKITNCMEEQGSTRRQERGQKFLHLQKEMRVVGFSLCWPLIYSLPGYIIIPALKRVGVVQTPRQPFEMELYRCLFIPFRSSFWPCKYLLMNKRSGSSHHGLDNKWGGELQINPNSKTSQRRCFFAVPGLSHPFWPGAPLEASRLDRTPNHCSNQKSAQADQN